MPNARISNTSPSARVSSFQVGRTGTGEMINPIVAGMPMGLLLVLTYSGPATSNTEVPYGDFRPNARIENTIVNNRIFNT